MNFRCPACGVEFVQPAEAREIERLNDEIERLRAIERSNEATIKVLTRIKDEALDEIKRLRSALEKIESIGTIESLEQTKIAREALKGEKG